MRIGRKETPAGFTLASGRPPYDGRDGRFCHPFLDDQGAQVKFDPESKAFHLANAWWLAEIATLVYRGCQDIEDQLREKGLVLAQWFANPATGTEGCVIRSPNGPFWVVAFRGTEARGADEQPFSLDFSNVISDVITDLEFLPEPWTGGGNIHSGFKRAFESVWYGDNGMKGFLDNKCGRERHRVWFTGHSLGAALATLAAQSFGPDAAGLYTFGSPRVGDHEFVVCPFPPAFRFVNHKDIVCHLPPFGFHSLGQCKYFDETGVMHDHIPLGLFFEPPPFMLLTQIFTSPGLPCLGLDAANCLPLPDFINDHVPVYYCNRIWNRFVEVGLVS